jgi:hypothetical protein
LFSQLPKVNLVIPDILTFIFSANLRLLDKLKTTMASLNQFDDDVMAMYHDGIKKSFDKPWLALLGVTTLN